MEYKTDDLIIDTRELSELINDLQYVANKKGLDLDAWKMYAAFYEQQPSCKHLIGTAHYDQGMTKKYDTCGCLINEVLESKIWFAKKYFNNLEQVRGSKNE